MCNGHNHNLVEIYRAGCGWNEDHVVRWCEDCGAVVVDLESDGRIFGYVVPMQFPKDRKKEISL